jgi:hypothetical protein
VTGVVKSGVTFTRADIFADENGGELAWFTEFELVVGVDAVFVDDVEERGEDLVYFGFGGGGEGGKGHWLYSVLGFI